MKKIIGKFFFKFSQGMCSWVAFAWIFFSGFFLFFFLFFFGGGGDLWGISVTGSNNRVFRNSDISCSLVTGPTGILGKCTITHASITTEEKGSLEK